jgi:hypothetical protein
MVTKKQREGRGREGMSVDGVRERLVTDDIDIVRCLPTYPDHNRWERLERWHVSVWSREIDTDSPTAAVQEPFGRFGLGEP